MKAMISSTAVDLPEHRRQVVEACLRQSVFPIGMEQLPARDAHAVKVSLEMVDQADIYIGVYAWRYGWVPEGSEISITEMEFNRAVERQKRSELKEILIFIMHREHDIKPWDMEVDAIAQKKLQKFKERTSSGRVRKEFRNADDLRGLVVQALADFRRRFDAEAGGQPTISFHPSSNIPTAPTPYIAHPYVLLQTKNVIGRRKELNLLNDWITSNKEVPADTRIFTVVGLGGMGKSALTWKWFEDIAPNELPDLKGRMWWSFYESDAHWENFVIRTLAYTAGIPDSEVRQFSPVEREERLFHRLDECPFLLVLDGLERILLAYARMDAAHLPDEDLEDQTISASSGAVSLTGDVTDTFLGKHRLRQCTDVRAGAFLRKLARVRGSRILLSSRLYPAELQTQTEQPLPGCYAMLLEGLIDDDALALWRAFIGGERSGTSNQLLPLFQAFRNYPLLLRALAGEVAQNRSYPGDFDGWRRDHPDFDPTALPLRNAKTHVLKFALRGLNETQRRVLHTLAAFRMPATWETVSALLAGKEKRKPCRNNFTLDRVLAELEDRGLIGWDRASNRYDLHPIVRSVAWNALDRRTRRGLHRNIQSYFEAIPAPALFAVQSIDELAPAVEICNSLIALERFSDAQEVFRERLDHPTKDLGAAMLRVELLRPLVGDTVDGLPRIDNPEDLEDILAALGNAFGDSGDLSQALHFTNCAHALSLQSPILAGPYTSVLLDISRYSLLAGKIHAAQRAAMEATPQPARKAEIEWVYPTSLAICGMVLAARGSMDKAKVTLQQAVLFVANPFQKADDGWLRRAIAQYKIWCGHGEQIRTLDLNPLSTTDFFVTRDPHEIIRAARLCGQVALSVGNHSEAKQNLQDALNRARAIGFVEEELPALTSLAELHRQQEEYDIAFELLEQAWTPAERGPYRLWHADACNVLTQLHCDVGHRAEAIEAATAAYQLAWCDGPPFAYHYGHAQARRHLQKLAASEPQLPPFDKSNFPPMPEEELNIDNDSDYGTIRVLEPPGAT